MAEVPLMQQARKAIREGRLVDARSFLRQVIHQEPQNHAAWLLLARATPDKSLAAEYIERARHLQPESPLVQQAAENLISNRMVVSKRRAFGWHFVPVLVGLVLLLGLLGMGFREAAWEQVYALQNDSVDSAAAPPLEAEQKGPEQVPHKADDSREMAPTGSETIADGGATDEVNSPAILPTTDVSKKNEIASASVDDSNGSQKVISSESQEALPATILKGIDTENSSSEDEEASAATDASAVTATEGASDEAATKESSDGSETTNAAADDVVIEDSTEIEEEAQDLENIESEPTMEEAVAAFDPSEAAPSERWIDVNLTTQTLVAYEGDTPVLNSLISSGMWQFPTVTGQFRTWMKYETQNMTGYHLGYNYSLDDVPHVMYFFEDYAIHGAYWHNNFGSPMSHGCVNVNTVDAAWLYDWAPMGTVVNVHQ